MKFWAVNIASPWEPQSRIREGWGDQPHPGQNRAVAGPGPAPRPRGTPWTGGRALEQRSSTVLRGRPASPGLSGFRASRVAPTVTSRGAGGVPSTGRPHCRARPLTARRPSPARARPGAQGPWVRPGERGCRGPPIPQGLARPRPWMTIKRRPQARVAASNQPGASSAVRHAGPPLPRAPLMDWLSRWALRSSGRSLGRETVLQVPAWEEHRQRRRSGGRRRGGVCGPALQRPGSGLAPAPSRLPDPAGPRGAICATIPGPPHQLSESLPSLRVVPLAAGYTLVGSPSSAARAQMLAPTEVTLSNIKKTQAL